MACRTDRADWGPVDTEELSALEQAQLEEALQLSLALEESLKQQPAHHYSVYGDSAVDIDAFGVVSCSLWPMKCSSLHVQTFASADFVLLGIFF